MGDRDPTLKNRKNIGFLCNTRLNPLKITKLPSQHLMLDHHRHASKTPFNGVLLAGRGWPTNSGIWIFPPLIDKKQNITCLSWTPSDKTFWIRTCSMSDNFQDSFKFFIMLHGHVLEIASSAGYLGVDISSGLSWNSHIDGIPSKAISTLGFIKNNKIKNVRVRETAYNTLVRPQLEYVIPIWNPYTKRKIFQLKKVQRRAVRWTTRNYNCWSSVTAMLQNLGWETLEQMHGLAYMLV